MFSTLKFIVIFIAFTCQLSRALENFSPSEIANVNAINSLMTEEWRENLSIYPTSQNSASNDISSDINSAPSGVSTDNANGEKFELLLKKRRVILN